MLARAAGIASIAAGQLPALCDRQSFHIAKTIAPLIGVSTGRCYMLPAGPGSDPRRRWLERSTREFVSGKPVKDACSVLHRLGIPAGR